MSELGPSVLVVESPGTEAGLIPQIEQRVGVATLDTAVAANLGRLGLPGLKEAVAGDSEDGKFSST